MGIALVAFAHHANGHMTKPVTDHLFLERIAADIRAVQEACKPGTTENALRHCPTQLRNLLVYRQFQKAWRMAGLQGSAVIPTTKLNRRAGVGDFGAATTAIDDEGLVPFGSISPVAIGYQDEDGNFHWQPSGGGKTSFVWYSGCESNDKEHHDVWEDAGLSINDFSQGSILFYLDRYISRETVIKYIANTEGGAHYDNKAKEQKDFSALKEISQSHVSDGRDTIFSCLMAIGQDLGNAPDVATMLARIDALVIRDPYRR